MLGFGEKVEPQGTENDSPSPWTGALGRAMSEARTKLSGTGKRSKKTTENDNESQTGRSLSEEDLRKVRAMFSPEAWRTMIKTPFVLGRVITGRDCWDLDKTEEDSLATTTAASAEYFLQSDPKWVCLSICMFNWSVILTSKFIANAAAQRREEVHNADSQQPRAA